MSLLPFLAWDDFDTFTIGTNVAGHTLRGGGAPTYKPQYSTTAILPYKRRYLEFLTDATTDYHAISRDACDGLRDFDRVFGFAMSLCTVEELHLYARGAGTGTMTDFVRASIVLATGAIRIDKMIASAYTAGSGGSAGTVTLTAGHAYLGRFNGNGATVSLKIWDASLGMAGEPTAFDLAPGGMPTPSGWHGFGGKHTTLTGKVAAFNFDAFSNTAAAAVCPRTNAERTAWLAKQDQLRIVVAKMRATGYDSSGSPYTNVVKAYIANHGYTSAAQDTPSLQHFDACITGVPAISREMPAALSGQAQVSIGRMKVLNPTQGKTAAALLLDGSTGARATAPDSAAVSITGDWDIRARIAPTDWTPAGKQIIVGKHAASNNSIAFSLAASSGGLLQVQWSADGTTDRVEQSTAATGFTDGSAHWVRVTVDVNNGAGGTDVKFYTSEDGYTWSQLGATKTTAGTLAVFDGTASLIVGDWQTAANPLAGRVYAAQVYNGIGGTLVAFMDPNAYTGAGAWVAMTGETWTLGGTASIAAVPALVPGAGLRDDWLRVHWLRDGFELILLGQGWPLHDGMHLIRGRLGNPVATDLKTLEFPIADMSEALLAPLFTKKFSSYDLTGQYFPLLLGQVGGRIDLTPLDYVNRRYVLSAGSMFTTPVYTEAHTYIFDNNVEIRGPTGLTISAVNAGTDTLTASANHGMVDGYRVWFDGSVGSPPAPLANEVIYYAVSTTVGGTDFKLSLTRGGAAINITGTTTGAHFDGYGYDFEEYADGSGVVYTIVTLAAAPTPGGRLTASFLKSGSVYANIADAGTILADAIFTYGAISLNYKDTAKFAALTAAQSGYKAGIWLDTQPHTINEAAAAIAAGANCWYGGAADGPIQVGAVALPGTSVLSLDRSDIAGIRQTDTVRQVDFAKAVTTYAPAFLTQGAIQNGAAEGMQQSITMAPYSYGATSTPLDDFPALSDADTARRFDLIAATSATATSLRAELIALYKYRLGVFEVTTAKLTPLECTVGDTVSIDFPRLGFKQWNSGDPASPDNTATIDSRLAVVVGHYLKPNKAGNSYSHVDLKVYRRIPGYYPTANLN